jgi:hypothetical protein
LGAAGNSFQRFRERGLEAVPAERTDHPGESGDRASSEVCAALCIPVRLPCIDRFHAIAHHRVAGILEIPAGLGGIRDETLRLNALIAPLQADQAIRTIAITAAHLAGSQGIGALPAVTLESANQARNARVVRFLTWAACRFGVQSHAKRAEVHAHKTGIANEAAVEKVTLVVA